MKIITAILLLLMFVGYITNASTITLVGDSTVASQNPAWTEMAGWGQSLHQYTLPGNNITNNAIGGKSSKSYITEGHWANISNSLGDYVFIQFGHNDVPGAGADNESLSGEVPDPLPASGFGSADVDWYRNNITTYITDAQSAGAIPIVIMPMERALFRNGSVQRHTEPYAIAASEVASSYGVAVVDLNTYSVDLYNELGQPAFEYYHMIDGSLDQTHFNAFGSSLYAGEIARQLQHTGLFAIPADTDSDGDVDDSDLGTVFANYTGPVGAFGYKLLSDGDIDGDGDVDDSDVGAIFAAYTGSGGLSPVPEPSTIISILIIIMMVVLYYENKNIRMPL